MKKSEMADMVYSDLVFVGHVCVLFSYIVAVNLRSVSVQDEISKLEDSAQDVLDKLKCAKVSRSHSR